MRISTVGGGSSNATLGVGGGGLGGFTGAVGAGGGGTSAVTGPGTAVPEEVVEAVALAAWWRAARSRLRSFSDGPRWRDRRGGGWRKGGSRDRREGVGCAWLAQGAVEFNFGLTTTSGQF